MYNNSVCFTRREYVLILHEVYRLRTYHRNLGIALMTLAITLTGLSVNAQSNRSDLPYKSVTDAKPTAYVLNDGRSSNGISEVQAYQKSLVRSAVPVTAKMRKAGLVPGNQPLGIDTLVIHKANGKYVRASTTRSGSISFVVPTTGTGAWTADQAAFIKQVADQAVVELSSVCGEPLNGSVITIVNYDAEISDRNAVAGGIYDVSAGRFYFPVYNSEVSVIANLTHLVAHAMRGSDMFAYDAWEEGFARAVGQIAAPRVAQALNRGTSVIDALRRESNYHALPFYDLLNQPALSNNTFVPKSQNAEAIESGTIGGIWLPRYMMSGSVWMKAYIEDPLFFKNFMSAYKNAGGAAIAGNIPALRTVLRQVLPTIEAAPIDTWFEKQYILDNSIHVGRKLYAYCVPIRTSSGTDSSVFIDLIYVNTSVDGDEQPISGYCYPQYYDYEEVRIYPGAQYESVELYQGEGAFSPNFNNDFLGGAQRVRIVLPTGMESLELPYAFGQSGSTAQPNTMYGVVDGLTTGSVEVSSAVGTAVGSIVRGSFGLQLPSGSFNTPRAYTVKIKDNSGNLLYTRQVNLGYTEGVLYINLNDQTTTANHGFASGIQMISIPMSFRETDNAAVLGVNASALQLARWIQPNKAYSYYPSIDSFAPGRAFWMKTSNSFVSSLTGYSTPMDRESRFSTVYGWNMIGLPVDRTVSVSDIMVQVQDGTPIGFDAAVTNGVVGNSFIKYDAGYVPVLSGGTLSPWVGYWVRVKQSEGLTFIIPAIDSSVSAQSVSSRSASKMLASANAGWKCGIQMQVNNQNAKLWFGQNKAATTGFDNAFDAEYSMSDPSGLAVQFTGSQPLLQDIRPTAKKTQWKISLSGAPSKSYVKISMLDRGNFPGTGRLVVNDTKSFTTFLLSGGMPVTIKTDSKGCASLLLSYQN